jgi:hypothetical protein
MDPCLPIADRVRIDELLSFPARHLGGLPLPVRIDLEAHGIAHEIVWTSELRCAPPRSIAFDADEVRAIGIGVQAERLWPADFRGLCLRKLHDPSFRVTAQTALSGAQPDPGPAWSLARVLSTLELQLVDATWAAPVEDSEESHVMGAAA